jgi:hypothetical protein
MSLARASSHRLTAQFERRRAPMMNQVNGVARLNSAFEPEENHLHLDSP